MRDYYIDFENYLGSDAWGVRLAYYDGSDNMEYLCKNVDNKAATDADNWDITKYIYTAGNLVRWENLTGSVDNRAVLDWRT